jgi:hypothetical protein
MKITEQEYYNGLDKISLLDYKIDLNRNCNYYISGKNRYELHTDTNDGITNEYYKFQLSNKGIKQ